MLRIFGKRFSRLAAGQGSRIVAAVVVMGALMVAAALPLIDGLGRNARLASSVSEDLVPTDIRVMALANSILEAQSALEAFLLTGDERDRTRFDEAVEMVHVTLPALKESQRMPGFESAESFQGMVSGVGDLVTKLEGQAAEVFALKDRPDNVKAQHLINTRGEKLLTRAHAFIDLIMETWAANGSSPDALTLSALMGFQDSLNRMMSNMRGYLFMREDLFHQQFEREQHRNERIFSIISDRLADENPAVRVFIGGLEVTRSKLMKIFTQAFAERNAEGWRRDLEYYHTQITPTIESLKWVLYTLSDTTNQAISTVSTQSTGHGLALKRWVFFGALAFLVVGALFGVWIYRCVGVFTHQIGEASETLNHMSGKFREETEQQAREAGHQVEEIDAVYRTLTELKGALSEIRSQTEEMAQQTDAASLECVQGMEVLGDSQKRMAAILTQSREISLAMGETRRQTEQMDGILAILNELVDQTKLLSFNATIEAAGAGRSGQRFAVVAKQVRRLATRAQEATQEIRQMIKQVQETAENTRRATERGTSAINEGENLMNVVTERLDAIVGAVSQVSDMAGRIFLATQAQDKSVTQVDKFVDEAKGTAERVSSRTEQTRDTATQLEGTAKDLASLVGK